MFLNKDLSNYWIAMFTAFFDDSGSRNTGTVVVAGYVAPVLQWAKFKNEWDGVLNDANYGLPHGSIFHMKDFAHSRGAFRVFDGHLADPEKARRRKRFIEQLVGFTKIRATESFSFSLREQDYEEANGRFVLREHFGGPFAFAGRVCAGFVRTWANSSNPPVDMSQVEFIFEQGIKGWGDLQQRMVFDGFLSPTQKPKSREYPPLQAADLIAWEFHKAMRQAFNRELNNLRKSFEELMKMPGHNGVAPDVTELEKICEQLGVPLR